MALQLLKCIVIIYKVSIYLIKMKDSWNGFMSGLWSALTNLQMFLYATYITVL